MSKAFDPRKITLERPAVLDESGHRMFLHPASVKGSFRTARNWVYAGLIFVFLVLPWTHFRGKQTILLDLPQREFTFFGQTFLAHDTPLIFLPLMIAVFSIIFVTSIFGRAWCGWACPQTVFIDGVFRKIEAWIEGNHLQRVQLDKSKWTLKKLGKRLAKWTAFVMVSEHIAHSFFAYFVGARELVWTTMGSPLDSWSLFLAVQFLSAILLFDFGWFREQFCLIMCPYGRFQSVLMGPHSLAVMYDEDRGEPRGRGKATEPSRGDCVDCFRCVSVCPTGIDIRNGVQLECIACTACIDACDNVMLKLGRPKGLVRYSSENRMVSKGTKIALSPATYVYGGILVALISTLAYFISQRGQLDFQVLRGLGSPYTLVETKTGSTITNHFRIHMSNQTKEPIVLNSLLGPEGVEIVAPTLPVSIEMQQDAWVHFFVKFPEEKSPGITRKTSQFIAKITGTKANQFQEGFEVQLLAPKTQN